MFSDIDIGKLVIITQSQSRLILFKLLTSLGLDAKNYDMASTPLEVVEHLLRLVLIFLFNTLRPTSIAIPSGADHYNSQPTSLT